MSTEVRQERVLDVVFEAPASVSIYWQALVAADRGRDADAVRGAHRGAVDAAIGALERGGLWLASTPVGGQGRAYEPLAAEVRVVEHESSGAEGLHSHVLVEVPPQGGVIDRPAAERAMPHVRARYDRALVDVLTGHVGLPMRDDGERPELAAVSSDVLAGRHPTPCLVITGTLQLR